MRYANRECNAIMTIAKCTNTAASSIDNNHHSSTPTVWFASGTTYHRRRYQNLGSWIYLRSYTIGILVVNYGGLRYSHTYRNTITKQFKCPNPGQCKVLYKVSLKNVSDSHQNKPLGFTPNSQSCFDLLQKNKRSNKVPTFREILVIFTLTALKNYFTPFHIL